MLQDIVTKWEEGKEELENYFRITPTKEYQDYIDIVKLVAKYIIYRKHNTFCKEDIGVEETIIGSYSGVNIYIIHNYDSFSKIYLVKIFYGSCSLCDTLQGIQIEDEGDYATEAQIKDYMTLALHIVQAVKEI